ncbi:hypothetical protein [Methanolobus psychrotolerans]|uniref:hypothetical protein n=1 Tax=Methanolobus psychrotolerans TaxID=1874706 RepID=UPI0013EABA46|nr:hypothetical protein [Methanolobus psychrotolerans]
MPESLKIGMHERTISRMSPEPSSELKDERSARSEKEGFYSSRGQAFIRVR